MSDTVKREKVIATINTMYDCCDTGDITDYRDLMLEAVKVLPSADRPQGKWRKRFGSINCSVCEHSHWSACFEDLVKSFNYCPNCGARMKGADDE